MSLRNILFYVFGLLFCLAVQVLLLRNLIFLNYAFCFLYVGAVLVLPPELDKSLYLLIAFCCGLLLDVFTNTLGLHAAATVLVAYLRSFLLERHVKQTGEELMSLTLRRLGLVQFISVFFPLVFIHSAALFLIEANSFNLILHTLLRIGASSVYTMLGILLWQSFARD